MLPSSFAALDNLPLTIGGKVDRQALPEISCDMTAKETYVAPRTAVERILSGIWSEMLKRGPVGITDNFFEIGGHSLLATRVLIRVQDLLGVTVPLRSFFAEATLQDLAAAAVNSADDPHSLEQAAQLLLEVTELSESEALSMLGKISSKRPAKTARADG
jgi:hypothetical protein